MATLIYDIPKLNGQFGAQIEKEYLEGSYSYSLAEKYLNDRTKSLYIKKILEYRGVKIRTRSEVKQQIDKENQGKSVIGYNRRLYTLNENYFKTFSSNMATFLGYIATDGCVSGGTLKLGLASRDEEYLCKLKEELNYSGPIHRKTSKAIKDGDKIYSVSTLDIKSKEIVQDLNNLNIVENKSLILKDFNIPEEYEMDFFIGAFDGDGSVGRNTGERCKNSIQIRLRICSASRDFIEYLKNIMDKHGFNCSGITERSKNRIHPIYDLTYSTKNAIRFYEEYYSKSNLTLNRKKKKFEELVEARKQYEEKLQEQNEERRLKVKII